MESAIPGHLLMERTRHKRVPDDYAPPYPSFVARSSTAVRQVVMAYLGLQFRGEQPPLDVLDAAFGAVDGPGHHDRAIHDGPGGTQEIVSIGYWDDPAAFDRWFAAHADSWLGDDVRDGNGRWAEILRPTVEEHETLFSSLGRPEGVAVLADGLSGEIQEHAYWGGMRDRIPLSQTDPMLGLGAPAAEEEAGRVRVRPPGGLCLIRSGRTGPTPTATSAACTSRTSSRCCGRAWSSCATRARRWVVSPTATSPSRGANAATA